MITQKNTTIRKSYKQEMQHLQQYKSFSNLTSGNFLQLEYSTAVMLNKLITIFHDWVGSVNKKASTLWILHAELIAFLLQRKPPCNPQKGKVQVFWNVIDVDRLNRNSRFLWENPYYQPRKINTLIFWSSTLCKTQSKKAFRYWYRLVEQ